MSIRLGYIDYLPSSGPEAFTPINIQVSESYASKMTVSRYGTNQQNLKDAKSSITLEFDALADATVIRIRELLQERNYEKKIFLNEPATYQMYDVSSFGTSGYCLSNTTLSSVTTFNVTEKNRMKWIDSDYYSKSNSTHKYTYLSFQFNISSFINAYGADAIDRLTLFLHNPYCTVYNGEDTLPAAFRVLAYNGTDYVEIGEQSYTISDVNLRAAGKMNQQFFSLRKVAEFTNIASDISSSTYARFAIVNKEPLTIGSHTGTIGLNCVGLFVNGYCVKQVNADNATYRNSYTGSGITSTIELEEVL